MPRRCCEQVINRLAKRVGTTSVYEDLSPGYVATFEFPG
jgi:hypothetical protein